MSDSWIYIIPDDPTYQPAADCHEPAIAYFRGIAPQADDVGVEIYDGISCFDCGANLESIACPACGAEIEMEAWGEWMEADYDDEQFRLTPRALPCCGAECTLHELRYDLPQGFGRFGVFAMNPNLTDVTDMQCAEFARILGGPVRVITRQL